MEIEGDLDLLHLLEDGGEYSQGLGVEVPKLEVIAFQDPCVLLIQQLEDLSQLIQFQVIKQLLRLIRNYTRPSAIILRLRTPPLHLLPPLFIQVLPDRQLLHIPLLGLPPCRGLEHCYRLTQRLLPELLLPLLETHPCHYGLRDLVDLGFEGVLLVGCLPGMLLGSLLDEGVHVELLVPMAMLGTLDLVVDFGAYDVDLRLEGALHDLFHVVLLPDLGYLALLADIILFCALDDILFIQFLDYLLADGVDLGTVVEGLLDLFRGLSALS